MPSVLHVLREDHATHIGGDLRQLSATVAGLQAAGLDAFASTISDAPARVDVIHLYNLQRPAALRRQLRLARQRWPDAAFALSPVWWPWRLRAMAGTGERALAARALKQGIKQTTWWAWVRRALATADLVLPNSLAELHALRQHYRLPPRSTGDDRWAVVPNGIHLDEWPFGRAETANRRAVLSDLGLDPDARLFVACVARVEPVKNQLALVRAVEILPDAALVLVGPVGEERYARLVRGQASSPATNGRVAFTGSQNTERIRELLAAVDVHVLASFRETPGLATLEAAACGCGVVVTEDGSATEYLGGAAHVAEPVDPASIARAIAAAHADPRQPAARKIVEHFDWARAVDALFSAYERLPGWPSTTSS